MKTKLKNFLKLFIFSVIIIFSNAIPTKAMAPPPPPPTPLPLPTPVYVPPTPVKMPTTSAKKPHPLSNLDNCPCCGMSYTPPKPGKCSACENCSCSCKSCGGCIKNSTNGRCSECINCPCDCEDEKDKSNNCKKCAKNALICNPCLNGKCIICGKCGKHKCPCREIDHAPCAICGSKCSNCLTDCKCKRCICKGCNKTIPDNQNKCNSCHKVRHKKCEMCLECCKCACDCCGYFWNNNRGGKCEFCFDKCKCPVCSGCVLDCNNCPCTCEACLGFVDDAKGPCGQCAPCSDCGKCNKHYCGGHGLADGDAPPEQPGDGGGSAGSSVRITLYDYDKKLLSSEAEENPGLFMRLNCDDDNKNGIIDKNEDDEVGNEDDLVWVYFAVWTDRSSGDVTIERSNKNIKLYKPSFDDNNKVDDSKAIVILGNNDSKNYTIDEFQNGDGSSFNPNNNGAIKGWCLMEGYEPGVTELKIRFDGEEDKGKITVCGPIIQKDGVDITDVIEVWAGEKIELSCGFVSPDATVVDYSWDIPETRIKNYICENTRGEVISLPESSLDNQNIAFYWTDGTDEGGVIKKVKCTVTLDTGELITVEAVFKVKLPILRFNYEELYGERYYEGDAWIGSDAAGNDYGLWKGNSFGTLPPAQPGKSSGFETSVRLQNEAIGITAWIQIINDSDADWWYYPDYWHIHKTCMGLDGEISSGYGFSDCPGIGLPQNCYIGRREDNFDTYLMFKSNKQDSIWVPVWRIFWHWLAVAEAPILENWSIIHYERTFHQFEITELTGYLPSWDKVETPE